MTAPTVLSLSPPIERAGVLRCLDYPPGREPAPRIAATLEAMLTEARGLVRARGAWLSVAPERCAEFGLAPVEAEGLVLGLVTLGSSLEARVASLQASGSITRALVLDACGSSAAEEAADGLSVQALCSLGLAVKAGAPAGPPGCRMSPGYGGWGLQQQPALLARLDAPALGVELTPGLMMRPRKSVSFALWLGARERPAEGLAGCRACGLRRCRYAG